MYDAVHEKKYVKLADRNQIFHIHYVAEIHAADLAAIMAAYAEEEPLQDDDSSSEAD